MTTSPTLRWPQQCAAESKALTQEQRQQFLDLIWDGPTIGEAADAVGISLEAACGVIYMNIGETKFLKRETS